jgi:hypothetical protein
MDANERELRRAVVSRRAGHPAAEHGINSFIRVYSRPFAVLLSPPFAVYGGFGR